MRAVNHNSILALVVLMAGVGTALGGAEPIPFTREPLKASGVSLDLHDGRVEVAVDDIEQPFVEVTPMGQLDDVAVVMVTETRGQLQVVQPHGAETNVPVMVRIVLTPSQRVSLSGRGVQVSLVDRREELSEQLWSELDQEITLDRAKVTSPGGTASRYVIEVQDSSVDLRRLTGATVSGLGNDVSLSRCRGPFVFDLDDAEVSVDEHWGALYLRGRNAGFQLDGATGRLDLDLEDSSLTVVGGRGSLHGRADRSSVTVNGWEGPVTLEGEEARVMAQNLPSAQDFLTLRGTGHELTANDVAGAVRIDVAAGRVEARAIAGRAILAAERASDLLLDEVGGNVELDLGDGSLATLERVAGMVEGRVQGAELTASGVEEGVDLTGRDAVVSLSGVSQGVRIDFANSIVDVETLSRFTADLSFKGETEARIGVPTPCLVKVGDARDGIEPPVGLGLGPCEVYERRAMRRFRGGPNPVTVNLSMGADCQVDFWGR
jgi:hypothetical protein